MERFENDIYRLIQAGQYLFQQGWSPATSSNYSVKLSESEILITASGKHKGKLTPDDFIVVDLEGKIVVPNVNRDRPSAETLLHCQLYRNATEIHSVLHTHSVAATVLSKHLKSNHVLAFEGYELQKAFNGTSTHDTVTTLPIVENHQDMIELSKIVDGALKQHPFSPGYIIRGHGLYTWGASLEDALRHIDALEFLLECELRTPPPP